jgi:hypothetical protein
LYETSERSPGFIFYHVSPFIFLMAPYLNASRLIESENPGYSPVSIQTGSYYFYRRQSPDDPEEKFGKIPTISLASAGRFHQYLPAECF